VTTKDALLKAVVEPNLKADLRALPLDAREGFVMSRVDGTCSVKTLAMLVGMSEEEVCVIVDKLLTLGAVGLKIARPPPPPVTRAAPSPSPAPAPARVPRQRPRETVDLADDEQQRIWDMNEALGSMSHYDVLQIPRDTPTGDLKAAYYRFSKDFHPDRFFGRKLGSYKPMLEMLFRAGKTAYEVLSETSLRTAYDKKLPAIPAPLEIDNDFARRAALEAHRQKILDERKAKSRNPFQDQVERAKIYAIEGEAFFVRGDLVSSVSRFALALAYDPLNDIYQRRHKELLPMANEARTRILVASAAKDIARGDFAAAAQAYCEAHDIMPANASFAARAAEYFYKQGIQTDEALRLITLAAERAQKNGDYKLILALILEKKGETALARDAVKAAITLGCEDPECKKLSKRLK